MVYHLHTETLRIGLSKYLKAVNGICVIFISSERFDILHDPLGVGKHGKSETLGLTSSSTLAFHVFFPMRVSPNLSTFFPT